MADTWQSTDATQPAQDKSQTIALQYLIDREQTLLDRLHSEHTQLHEALRRQRAVKTAQLLHRYWTAPPTTSTSEPNLPPVLKQGQPVVPEQAAGYPKRLLNLVGGAEALLALPVLRVEEKLGAQGRINQLRPDHLDAPVMRGAWPSTRHFLAFKLWTQIKPTVAPEPGLVVLYQDEVQPLSWHTLNPMRFRTDAQQLHFEPTFMELRYDRVIGNQEGERFLQALERISCSADGHIGVFWRQRPSVKMSKRVSFAETAVQATRSSPTPSPSPPSALLASLAIDTNPDIEREDYGQDGSVPAGKSEIAVTDGQQERTPDSQAKDGGGPSHAPARAAVEEKAKVRLHSTGSASVPTAATKKKPSARPALTKRRVTPAAHVSVQARAASGAHQAATPSSAPQTGDRRAKPSWR